MLTASDDCGVTNITASIDPFTVDQCLGYSVTHRWIATDQCGNATTVTETFNVLPDTEGPAFDAQPSALADITCEDALPTQEVLTATDNCSIATVNASVDPYTEDLCNCLLYTSPSPRDKRQSRMPSSA